MPQRPGKVSCLQYLPTPAGIWFVLVSSLRDHTDQQRISQGGVFSSVTGILKTATGSTQKAEKKARQTKTSPADVVGVFLTILLCVCALITSLQISWSGCKDSQTSADTFEGGQSTGAMSFVCNTVYLMLSRLLITT